MKFEIHQSLHGYQNGHQLIASSTELSIELRKLMVFQTDLSGPYVDKGYETYLSGFPIPGERLYAFSKTWYADEMKRPGCVWTHSLFINFADLGKIPELEYLGNYFYKPIRDDFSYYRKSLILTDIILRKSLNYNEFENKDIDSIVDSVYSFPFKTILIPSSSSNNFDKEILNIWSNQWPRLRRNFSFSTGSLSLRTVNDKEFDVQVIPLQMKSQIEKQSGNAIIIKSIENIHSKWLNIFSIYPKQKIREFLWTFGSDISGERKNYMPLLKMFDKIYNEESEFEDIINELATQFPNKEDAKYLKRELLGKESLINKKAQEKQIIIYLLSNDKIDFLQLSELNIGDRLLELLESKRLSVSELLDIFQNIQPGRLENKLSDYIGAQDLSLAELFNLDEDILLELVDKLLPLAINNDFWKLSMKIQEHIVQKISNEISSNDWHKYIHPMLEANSEIIFEAKRYLGNSVVLQSLDWLNKSMASKKLLPIWEQYIVVNCFDLFRNWVSNNENMLSEKVFLLIFRYCDFDKIRQIKLSSTTWTNFYKNYKNRNSKEVNFVVIACNILSIGLSNSAYRSDLIVQECFVDVFDMAYSSKINSSTWGFIPKDNSFEEDIPNPFMNLFNFLPWNFKKYNSVEDWDYCEILIRTLANKFLKFGWPRQSLLLTLKNSEVFERTVEYCLSSNKGQRLIIAILDDIDASRITPLPFQHKMLTRMI